MPSSEVSRDREEIYILYDLQCLTLDSKGIENERSGGGSSDDPLVLPDIKDMLKKKEIEQENARIEEEKRVNVKKIKRSDKEAFRKVSLMRVLFKVLLLGISHMPRSLYSYWSRSHTLMRTIPSLNKKSMEWSVPSWANAPSRFLAFQPVLCK